jgi:AraC-like DNA-binding protein
VSPERPSQAGYAEFASEMRDVFRCSWRRLGSVPRGARSTVLPDACADVVVDQSGAAVLVGPTMVPHRFALDPTTALRGLRLQPWAIPLLFRTTGTDLRDQVLSLEDLMGSRVAREAAESVWEARVPSCWRSTDTSPWQIDLVKRLLDAPSSLVEHTGREVGVSERQARRTTRQVTGLSPRELAHVGRLHRLVSMLDRGDHSLAVTAVEAGYTDQAHMTRVLKRLTGATPRRLRDERADLEHPGGDQALREVADLLTVG